MTFIQDRARGAAALLLLAACASSRADWVISADPAVVKVVPGNLQVQPQNPPGFSWARHSTKPPGYILELTLGGVVTTVATERNWYLPSKALAAGTYSWRVRPNNLLDWSTPRTFIISASSAVFQVPEESTLKNAITSHARPRALPEMYPLASAWTAAQSAERGAALAAMKNDVAWRISGMALLSDTEWQMYTPGTSAYSSQSQTMAQRVNTAGRQLESALLLYRLTGEQRYLDEALRRGNNIASLDPNGVTAYARQDQASRQISLSLVKAVDMLPDSVSVADPGLRRRWLDVVAVRTNAMYADLSGNDGRMDQYPFDSHGGSNLGYLAVISTLALGDLPAADIWFQFAFRNYAHVIYAWSGPEGGFANGTAYAQYTADIALQLWQPMTQASGVNFFSKPWSTGFLRFFAQFVPPGAPVHLFGDEHERLPDSRMLKAFASRFASPLAAWYVQNTVGAEDPMTLLQAPYPLPASSVAAQAPANAAMFPSIGWAAMHSNISDRARTSLYFKSSPYGSFNHSHGDQNGIVLFSGGRPLLIEAGYSDYYDSPLSKTWYRQSKAHNAITFDNGIGQVVDANTSNLIRNGKITAFSTTPALDYVAGDATAAYGGLLTSAVRQIWYLRSQDAIVVRDKIAAPLVRNFEWNMHAAVPIVAAGNGEHVITNVDRSVCIRPIVPGSMALQTRVGPAPKAGTFEAHAAYTVPLTKSAEFLVLLDVGCKRPVVTLTTTTTGRTLKVGAQTLTLPK